MHKQTVTKGHSLKNIEQATFNLTLKLEDARLGYQLDWANRKTILWSCVDYWFTVCQMFCSFSEKNRIEKVPLCQVKSDNEVILYVPDFEPYKHPVSNNSFKGTVHPN